jgi:hypothetical protein
LPKPNLNGKKGNEAAGWHDPIEMAAAAGMAKNDAQLKDAMGQIGHEFFHANSGTPHNGFFYNLNRFN